MMLKDEIKLTKLLNEIAQEKRRIVWCYGYEDAITDERNFELHNLYYQADVICGRIVHNPVAMK